jgi:hypothetical protein
MALTLPTGRIGFKWRYFVLLTRLTTLDASLVSSSGGFLFKSISHPPSQMGAAAAHAMANPHDDLVGVFAPEVFAHATHLLGFKIVLLGLCDH